MEEINITSPLTYVEPYLGDTTGRRRDGLGSSASSYHEINAIANGSHQYYFFCAQPGYSAKNQIPHPRNPLGAPYPRTSPSTLLEIPRYLSLTSPTHSRGALLMYEKVPPLNNHDSWADWNLFH